jgi:hypothetical protein
MSVKPLGGLIRLLWVGLSVGLPTVGRANDAQNQLMATTEEHRRAAFQVVIGGAGCDDVKRTFFQGEKPNGDAIWNIECDNDSYSIIVAPDGKTKLISCAQLMRLGGTQCFKPM